MKKTSTAAAQKVEKIEGQKLTTGLDLGDRSRRYCILDEAGNVLLEQKLPTTPTAMKEVFGKMPRSRIALETGMHSPWVSRLLGELGHEAIVAHARNVRLIGESRRKDDRFDARTLARLARIDPDLLGRVQQIAPESYPEVAGLEQVKGVGTLIALTYVLTLEDPRRFRKSRDVGCYLGLRPGRRNSGQGEPQLHISKEGDPYLRTMMVQSAHHILGPFGADSDLRRWGLRLAERGGKNAKKRAVVAVARKLAILLHRLWVSGEVYEPLRNRRQAPLPAAA
jgi:transposase